ncbi:hypothetical protein [Allomesorhizobium alhagi]|uniref:Uncharacterized protein n=1 Tax=Mesorhizobium alhagi CCNWXJ12-2 TaxID=1107882 RepID=H0HR41_9HYPH|nr:hypothetical protein [Mesorhizobium alhagi]EHK56821.1 hypothetical protein MAXJ12_13121 [Mesorhizobium alhagi CCNWXJ12-2]
MPWVRFTADFDWKPRPQVTIAYRMGQEVNVTTLCAARAVSASMAVRIKKAKKLNADQGEG